MRVFLADDEILVRVGLKSILDWRSLGHEIVGEAENGEEAYEKITKLDPDLLITDIKMPVTDGIELIRRVKDYDPDIRIIVLSGYDDYPLVREAMKLGAEDYVLKLDTDARALLQILERGAARPSHVSKPGDGIGPVRDLFFMEIISGTSTGAKRFQTRRRELEIDLHPHRTYCMIVWIREHNRFESTDEKELFRLVQSVKALIQESVDETLKGYCLQVKTGEFALYLSSTDIGREDGVCDYEIRATARRIREVIQRYLGFTVAIGAGSADTSAQGLRHAFEQARGARSAAEGAPDGYAACAQGETLSAKVSPPSGPASAMKYRNEIHRALARNEPARLNGVLKDLTREIRTGGIGREDYPKIASEIVFILAEYFDRYRIDAAAILKSTPTDYRDLKYLESPERMILWLKGLVENLVDSLQRGPALHPKIVERAKEFMSQNYAQHITLARIAEEIHLSPGYFCSLFKRYQGVGCVDYLNGVRIDNAKRLLREGKKKVYEVAYEVGFQNNNYFNRLFKRLTGRTPSEYRDMNIV